MDLSSIFTSLEISSPKPKRSWKRSRKNPRHIHIMGRGKIEIKRIENTNNRQVTYSKRRTGLMKKAKEINVLCEAKVAVVVFSSSGKMHDYISPGTSLPEMLAEYQKLSGKKIWDAKHEDLNNEIAMVKKENDRMQVELRHMRGEDIQSLHYKELMAIEAALDVGLDNIRDKKMEIYHRRVKNDQILEEENMQLNCVLQQQEEMKAMEVKHNAREMENRYRHPPVIDYESQMPFGFRVQPMQPNLQDRP